MSVFRKTVLASAILGAGLASTAGVAVAHTAHGHGGCLNDVTAKNTNSTGDSAGNTTGAPQDITASNTCDIFNGNTIDSKDNTAGGNIQNGDSTSVTQNKSTTTSSDNSTTTTTTTTTPAG